MNITSYSVRIRKITEVHYSAIIVLDIRQKKFGYMFYIFDRGISSRLNRPQTSLLRGLVERPKMDKTVSPIFFFFFNKHPRIAFYTRRTIR